VTAAATSERGGPTLTQTARDKTVDAAEAVRLIRSGDSVVVVGFAGCCLPARKRCLVAETDPPTERGGSAQAAGDPQRRAASPRRI
jgi:hypothetical protein